MSESDWLDEAMEGLWANDQCGGAVPLEIEEPGLTQLKQAIQQHEQQAINTVFAQVDPYIAPEFRELYEQLQSALTMEQES